MDTLLIFFGAIGAIIAIVFFVTQKLAEKKKLQFCSCEQKKIGDVKSLIQETSEALGDEVGVEDRVVVTGNVECADPLMSPLGNKPCVYYSTKVSITETEYYTERDSNGNERRRSRKRTRELSSSNNSTRFKLNDDTGSILIDPHEGVFEGLRKSVDKEEPVRGNNSAVSLSFGSFALSIPTVSSLDPSIVHYEEEIIPMNVPLTIIGTACMEMGETKLATKAKHKITVSTKSFDSMISELSASIKSKALGWKISGGIGIVLIIVGIIV